MKTVRAISVMGGAAALLFCFGGCTATVSGGEGGTDAGGETSTGEGGGEGGGMCSMEATCSNYCSVMMKSCGSQTGLVTSMATCMALCPKLDVGKSGDTMGNTIGCRVYHGCNAGASAAAAMMHCPHADIWQAAADGANCGTGCDAFCKVAQQVCPTEWPAAMMNLCLSQCGIWMPGTPGAASGNTRACRQYHLGAAAASAAAAMTHCPHTAMTSSMCM